MSIHTLKREQLVPRPLDEVFAFFADAGNLNAITPDWLRFRILTPLPAPMRAGLLLDYRISWRGVPLRWRTEIESWSPGRSFVDRQVRGPYALWHHTHRFEPAPGGTRLIDVVRYRLPLGPLGALTHWLLVRRDIESIFDYRAGEIARLFGVAERERESQSRDA